MHFKHGTFSCHWSDDNSEIYFVLNALAYCEVGYCKKVDMQVQVVALSYLGTAVLWGQPACPWPFTHFPRQHDKSTNATENRGQSIGTQ